MQPDCFWVLNKGANTSKLTNAQTQAVSKSGQKCLILLVWKDIEVYYINVLTSFKTITLLNTLEM